MIIFILILFILCLFIWIWYFPNIILIPLNSLYRTDPCPRTNFYSDFDTNIIFPARSKLESNWKNIKQEGQELYASLSDKNINYLNNYHINIGHETKKEWTTIPLRLFGQDDSYMNFCPLTSDILKNHPEIKSCIFSIMNPGKIISPHKGPYDGLIRYQLALDIPTPKDESEECFLYVTKDISNLKPEDKYYWTEGKGIMFDESNIHGAVNTTSKNRMVLLIDLERPYHYPIYQLLNKIIIYLMGLL